MPDINFGLYISGRVQSNANGRGVCGGNEDNHLCSKFGDADDVWLVHVVSGSDIILGR